MNNTAAIQFDTKSVNEIVNLINTEIDFTFADFNPSIVSDIYHADKDYDIEIGNLFISLNVEVSAYIEYEPATYWQPADSDYLWFDIDGVIIYDICIDGTSINEIIGEEESDLILKKIQDKLQKSLTNKFKI